ncbi:MAG: VTT domain-containing protein [Gammaproteobacteria bacterium]|jgi:uncharacterized membrane protein YdjX (TVP38/TMEM64 family)
MDFRILIRGLIHIAILLVAGFLLEHQVLGISLDKQWIDTVVRGQGFEGELWFIAAGALFTAVGLPRQVLSFLAGYAFDIWRGSLLALLATLAGCLVIFYYARWWRYRQVKERFPDKIQHIDDFISRNPFMMTLLVRLFPVGSNLITNMAGGVSRVKVLPFLLGSVLGYLPQTVIFALIGSGISIDPYLRISTGIIAFIISTLLGIYLFMKYRNGKPLNHATEQSALPDNNKPNIKKTDAA